MKAAALITGSHPHLLDHLSPIAYYLDIPCILTDEEDYELAKEFYPQVHFQYLSEYDLSLAHLANNYDLLIESKYWPEHLKKTFLTLHNKNMRFVFCPHGNSDKGRASDLLHPYSYQDTVFIYGNHMRDLLLDKGIWNKITNWLEIGNYRLEFYEENKLFYDNLAELKVFSHLPAQRTILYAPTWDDAEKSTSFFTFGKKILSHLPNDWNLIVKPHPLLEKRKPSDYYQTIGSILKKPNIHLLENFPSIYPLIQRCDVYLGDFSSIGYDFLYYQRPMYFYDPHHREKDDQSLFLHKAGMRIPEDCSNIYTFIEDTFSNEFQKIQKELYLYTFGKRGNPRAIFSELFMKAKRRQDKKTV